jgi:S1-C subfamily serine protease
MDNRFLPKLGIALTLACSAVACTQTTTATVPVTQTPPKAPFMMSADDLARAAENRAATRYVFFPRRSHATGVALSDDGWLLTCAHVVGGERGDLHVIATGKDGELGVIEGKTMYVDFVNDLAAVKFPARFPATVAIGDYDDMRLGERLYGISYPFDFGESYMLGNLSGQSASWVKLGGKHLVQREILVNVNESFGSSGSGLFRVSDGRFIGLVSNIKTRLAAGRKPMMNLVGAVPVDVIRDFLDRHRVPYQKTAPGG